MHVFALLYDHNNCDLYADIDSLMAGTEGSHDFTEPQMRALALAAMESPGEAIDLDGGMTTLRWLTVR